MHSVWHQCQLILARARWSGELAACKDCVFTLFTKSCSSPTQIPLQLDSAATSKLILIVVRSIDRRHVCWHGAMMWWMVLASSWNKVLSYLWASLFLHAQQCWNVLVTSQANPELDCWTVGFTRLAGGVPPAAGCHCGRRCWNLQKVLQPDLLCRVKWNRGYIFTLFTKTQFIPTQVPLQVDSATTSDFIHFFFFFCVKHIFTY